MIVALGIGHDGSKTILGIRQGATENATVVGELLGDLMQRGFDFSQPRRSTFSMAAKRCTRRLKSSRRSGANPKLPGAGEIY